MALASIETSDYGLGIYRGRKAPENAVYDLVNGLINDESLPYRRGGSAYKSNANAGDTLVGLFDGYLAAGLRTLAWADDPAAGSLAYVLGSDDATPAGLTLSKQINPLARGAIVNGILFLPCSDATSGIFFWGGSRKTLEAVTAPTVTLTNGSTTMTGSGTTWSTDYEAGVIVQDGSDEEPLYTAASVDSATQITLSAPWSGPTGSRSMTLYNHLNGSWTGSVPAPRLVAATGTPARLWTIAGNNRAYYSDRGGSHQGLTDNYIDLASASYIVGADGFQDTLCLFSTDGIWTVANTSLDPVDAYGNIQWAQQQISREFVLWGDPGIASASGALIVPGVDDVCLFTPDGTLVPITGARGSQTDGGIRALYRGYVAAGYQPGTASVYHGHYMLPVVTGSTLVDVLVCRLDHGFAWSRWAGHAAPVAFARRAGSTTRQPKLLGIKSERVTDLTGCFAPTSTNATDADGTTSDYVMVTRDYPTGESQQGFVQRIRSTFELEQAVSTDDFESTADGTLGSPWLAWGFSMPVIDGGVATTPLGDARDATRPESIGPDSFCQAVLATAITSGQSHSVGVGIRLTAHSVSADGYAFSAIDGTGGMKGRLYKGHNFTTLATSATVNYAGVTGVRISAVGSTIKGYFRISGAWVEVVSASDATYTLAGFPGFLIDTSASGGGTPPRVENVTWGLGAGTDPGVVTPAFSSDADDDVYAELTERGEQGGADGWSDSDGSTYQWALVGRRRQRIRFKFTLAGSCASFVWRSLEVMIRPTGKQ